VRLLELREELGGGALCCAVSKVEDYMMLELLQVFRTADWLTLFYTILLRFAIVVDLASYTFDALIVVVLGGMALL
jgi:hypothetical protein